MIIDLDPQGDELLAQATELAADKAAPNVVNEALREFIRLRSQQKIIELFGTVEYDEDYDYKEQRRRS